MVLVTGTLVMKSRAIRMEPTEPLTSKADYRIKDVQLEEESGNVRWKLVADQAEVFDAEGRTGLRRPVVGSVHREHDRARLERRKIVGAFTEADELDRNTQLLLHAEDDAALCRAVEFRQCQPGDVHDFGPVGLNPLSNPARDFGAHHLSSPGRRLDMAMVTGLVAFAAEVNLQRLEVAAPEHLAMLLKFFVK